MTLSCKRAARSRVTHDMHLTLPQRFAPLAFLVLCACADGSAMDSIGMPLDDADDRPTPLHFGLYVTPEENPIIPAERFTGFHTAVDFEVSADELENDVPVYAICDGKVLVSEFADGYGGVLVQSCRLQGQNVTVLYGHLDPASLSKKGTRLAKGTTIGVLGAHRDEESDGNRKHLHLSIHKGKQPQLLGYVQTEKELSQYIDPSIVLGITVTDGPYQVPEPPSSAAEQE